MAGTWAVLRAASWSVPRVSKSAASKATMLPVDSARTWAVDRTARSADSSAAAWAGVHAAT